MKMFLKFECSKCGEYECDCSYDEKNPRKSFLFHYVIYGMIPILYETGIGIGRNYDEALNDLVNKKGWPKYKILVVKHEII